MSFQNNGSPLFRNGAKIMKIVVSGATFITCFTTYICEYQAEYINSALTCLIFNSSIQISTFAKFDKKN